MRDFCEQLKISDLDDIDVIILQSGMGQMGGRGNAINSYSRHIFRI